MPQLRYWHSVEVSAGSRPMLREKEVDILVEDSVGLYQGKSKIINRQDGRAYLTSQRLIYIDNVSPKDMSLSIELSDVKKIDFTAKFLRSSSKITVFFKSFKPSNVRKPTTTRQTTWICPICSFSNQTSTSVNYSDDQFIPACETCGVKPNADVIKMAIDNARSNEPALAKPMATKAQKLECPACTFLNHPSMRNCEICGTVLPINTVNEATADEQEIFDDRIKIETETHDGLEEVSLPFIKLSFHKGGDKTFLQRLEQTLEKLEWEQLVQRGNVNRNVVPKKHTPERPESRGVGLHRLTQIEEDRTRKNEEIINSSLDDLHTLLAKANEIKSLIDSFKRLQTGDEQSQAKIIPTINQVTQSILRDPSKDDQKKLYLHEISRQISEFLITDKTLEQEGGIITLMDLYALYNRGRVGFNLISPEQLFGACSQFEALKLPLTLKKMNKVLVVQDLKFSDNDRLTSDIRKFIEIYGIEDTFKFKYCNVLRASEYFNWSLTITEEILDTGLVNGLLCVDQQVTGKHYYLNELFINDEITGKVEVRAETAASAEVQQFIPEPVFEDPHPSQIDELFTLKVPQSAPFPEAPNREDNPSYETPIPSTPVRSSKTLLELEGLQF